MIKLVYPKFWSEKGFLPLLLLPFSWIYILLGLLRNFFIKPIKFPAKTICIGNVTVGGTGKTQVALWLANQLNKKHSSFLIITKGYHSSLKGAKLVTKTDISSEVGDESIMLSQFAKVVAAQNITKALNIVKQNKPKIIIFDDGMQNPGFIKDKNVLVLDAQRGTGNSMIFPSGPLRENINSAVAKSDVIIMLGNDNCKDLSLINSCKAINKPFIKAKIVLANTIDKSTQYYAFAAIGNPQKFYNLLIGNGVRISETHSFPDHHHYTHDEINHLKEEAKKKNLSLITTRKDYVKISDLARSSTCDISSADIICADVELKFEEKDEEKILNVLL